MLAVHWTFEKWRKGLVVSGLFLDISGAFPNAVITQVVHNMCRHQIPIEYTQWITRRMTGRQTILTFDDYESEPFEVTNRLDQGDPSSSVFYGFYNTDLIEPTSDPNELKSAFVDDTIFFVTGTTYKENNTKLTNMMTRRNGAADWSKTHNSNFEVDKFASYTYPANTNQTPHARENKDQSHTLPSPLQTTPSTPRHHTSSSASS
jgi:Reverse transcriptase (RNA-dependent DNA polymerase)